MSFSAFRHLRILTLGHIHQKLLFLALAITGICAAAESLGTNRESSSGPLSHTDLIHQATILAADNHRIDVHSDGSVHILCGLQALAGEVTSTGLRIASTSTDEQGRAFAVEVRGIGRTEDGGVAKNLLDLHPISGGRVEVTGSTARVIRTTVSEEITTSADGIRQDFLVMARPAGIGDVVLDLRLPGVVIRERADGVALTLIGGRELAWHGLRVVDAHGVDVSAHWCVEASDAVTIRINDTGAIYPLRIDPTFTDADWLSMGGAPGTDAAVQAVVPYRGGIAIGGQFTIAGTAVANRVAWWNGSIWLNLGSGMNDTVYCMQATSTDLYAGGFFTTAGGTTASRVAKWDGSAWSALGSGANQGVYAMLLSGTDLYIGGSFSSVGGVAASSIAKWNGSAWSALGAGTNDQVRSMVISGTDLVAGGYFTTAGGSASNYIAKWNGSAWSALGTGTDYYVYALATIGTDIYAGGNFAHAGGITASRMAKWDGTTWSALIGSGINGIGTEVGSFVESLAVMGTDLYVGGGFSNTPTIGAAGINLVKWNGSAWSAVGSGVNGFAQALAVVGTDLYIGGTMGAQSGSTAKNIAKWNGSTLLALGSGMGDAVSTLTVSGTDLYAGGTFNVAPGGVSANNVAKWNGSTWSALGSGLDNNVFAIAVSGSTVYVGGQISAAGGVTANYIAQWNGTNWSSLGSGMNNLVTSLTILGGNLYAGGYFTTAGGVSANRIAKWNGSSWSALGSGLNNGVAALLPSGTDLYAAGYFTTAGGSTANHIAKWNGSTWSTLGSGVDNAAVALAMSGTDLYLGGYFLNAGGISANRVAKWNGSAWSAMGSGAGAAVLTFATSSTDVYAGGMFTTMGGITANRIAKWDGTMWSALGSGTNADVKSLALIGSDLYAGGLFTIAGNQVACYIARADLAGNTAPTAPIDSDSAPNVVSANAAIGTHVGITAISTDADTPILTYALADDAGGRFSINPSTGVVTVAGTLNVGSATIYTISVQASDGTSTSPTQAFTIALTNIGNLAPSTPTDNNANPNSVSANAAIGTVVGITAHSTDVDSPSVSYALTDNAGGRFTINAATGVVTVASALNPGSIANFFITVQASDGLLTSPTQSFSITVTSANSAAPSTPIDIDTSQNSITGDAVIGTTVGITAYSTDADSPSISYTLVDSAGGKFAIHSTTGIVTVAGALDANLPPNYLISIRASDGTLTSTAQPFIITVIAAPKNSSGGGCGLGSAIALMTLSLIGLARMRRSSSG